MDDLKLLGKVNDWHFPGVNPKSTQDPVLNKNILCRPLIIKSTKKCSFNIYITCFNVNRLIPHFNVVFSEILEHSYDVVAIKETFL